LNKQPLKTFRNESEQKRMERPGQHFSGEIREAKA